MTIPDAELRALVMRAQRARQFPFDDVQRQFERLRDEVAQSLALEQLAETYPGKLKKLIKDVSAEIDDAVEKELGPPPEPAPEPTPAHPQPEKPVFKERAPEPAEE